MKRSENILIIGTGKMALSLGDYLLERGFAVVWATENASQQEKLCSRIEKTKKRIQKYFPDQLSSYRAECILLGRSTLPSIEIVIESTSEILEKKQHCMHMVAQTLDDSTLFCTNSSSFLPDQIVPGCIGLHFFYPVSLTKCVEVVLPDACDRENKERILQFCKTADCQTALLSAVSPFVSNRLLLPLQSACFEALVQGWDPVQANTASVTKLIPHGHLAMMDNIGLDLLLNALPQYEKFPHFGPINFQLMYACLNKLTKLTKFGKKNRDGLLVGSGLPWTVEEKSESQFHTLQEKMEEIGKTACERALAEGCISYDDLFLIFTRVYNCEDFSQIFAPQNSL